MRSEEGGEVLGVVEYSTVGECVETNGEVLRRGGGGFRLMGASKPAGDLSASMGAIFIVLPYHEGSGGPKT